MRRLFTDDQISWAAQHPPEETRAWLRGELVSRFSDYVAGASWDQVLLRPDAVSPITRVHLDEPLAGTRAQAEEALEQATDGPSLIASVTTMLDDVRTTLPEKAPTPKEDS